MRDHDDAKADLLEQVTLFQDLDAVELRRLARSFRSEYVGEHLRLYRHGDPSDAFYVIRDGAVAIFREEVGKPLQLLARLGPGEFFGETGLFEGQRRSSTARTTVPTRLLKAPQPELMEFLDRHPTVAIKLQMAAARRHSENVAAALDLGARTEVRIHLAKPLTLVPQFGAPRPTNLENLSFGGLCLRGIPPAWSTGDEVGFQLRYADASLDVAGRVSWREDDQAGVAFLAEGDDHDARVRQLMRRLLE
ncbi:MAG: cyclic nucleotide-binding domain-containing protein [Acidobacteriota bacterium]